MQSFLLLPPLPGAKRLTQPTPHTHPEAPPCETNQQSLTAKMPNLPSLLPRTFAHSPFPPCSTAPSAPRPSAPTRKPSAAPPPTAATSSSSCPPAPANHSVINSP